MSTIGVSDTFKFQCVEGKRHAQQQSYSVVYGHDESRRKLGISSQGAFENTRKTSEETNVLERGSLVYPRINSVVPVPELNRVNSTDSEDSAVHYHQSLPKNTLEKMDSVNTTLSICRKTSTENTAKAPERPQDLINKTSFGVAKVNVKSSAQYRKSYAFKIWREKGCFPFRLEDQPSTEEQKKSKKYLNAIKSQKDRHNEEAWRAYKSSKTTRKLSEGVEFSCSNENSKEHQTPFTASQEGITKSDTVHHNNIPYYFKAKKDTSPKSQVTPVTKAIPTSVIHVNNTKSYTNCQPGINQALHQEATKVAPTEFRDQPFGRNDTRRSSVVQVTTGGGQIASRRERLSCTGETTARISEGASAENLKHPPIASTTASVDGHKDESCNSPEHRACSSAKIFENHLDLTMTDTSEEDNDMREVINRAEKKLESPLDNETLQTVASNSEVQDGHDSPSTHDNANMIAIMKSTLNKKYCKENVKPAGPGRKRRHENAGSVVDEPQRGRPKKSKATVFTRLDETLATTLADGIHNVNSEYFPIDALANKAAKEIGEKVSAIKSDPTKMSIKEKVEEIDRARLLLKELFDVTTESDGDHEMKTFDAASRSFGRKNILNHLTLLDRYFAEFQNKLFTHEQL